MGRTRKFKDGRTFLTDENYIIFEQTFRHYLTLPDLRLFTVNNCFISERGHFILNGRSWIKVDGPEGFNWTV